VRFDDGRSGAGSAMSVRAEDADPNQEMLVSDWRQSPSTTRADEPDDFIDIVNMPMKRNLDAWCIAEHMDMPVLLQVVLASRCTCTVVQHCVKKVKADNNRISDGVVIGLLRTP